MNKHRETSARTPWLLGFEGHLSGGEMAKSQFPAVFAAGSAWDTGDMKHRGVTLSPAVADPRGSQPQMLRMGSLPTDVTTSVQGLARVSQKQSCPQT